MERSKVEKDVPISVDRPENMPECFGKLFDAGDIECLQCKAFNMCAYFQLKDYPDGFLDQSRILHITDEDICNFIDTPKTPLQVAEWLLKEGRTTDKEAVKLRLQRFLRDEIRAKYQKGIITIL